METFKAIIIGVIQGITEWLPISSEGMTSLIMVNLFGSTLKEAVLLAIWVHAGTLLAAIVFFRKDLWDVLLNLVAYLGGSKRSREIGRLTWFLGVSTFLTALIGTPILLLGLDRIDIPGDFATFVIGLMLIITGVFQLLAGKVGRSFKDLKVADALTVGGVQGFSTLPGISRSGITVSTLLFLGYDAKEALRLSFLMSIPVVLGAEIGLVVLDKITFDMNTVAAAGASFLAGIATIKLFITVAERISFGYFCVVIGILSCLVLLI